MHEGEMCLYSSQRDGIVGIGQEMLGLESGYMTSVTVKARNGRGDNSSSVSNTRTALLGKIT